MCRVRPVSIMCVHAGRLSLLCDPELLLALGALPGACPTWVCLSRAAPCSWRTAKATQLNGRGRRFSREECIMLWESPLACNQRTPRLGSSPPLCQYPLLSLSARTRTSRGIHQSFYHTSMHSPLSLSQVAPLPQPNRICFDEKNCSC